MIYLHRKFKFHFTCKDRQDVKTKKQQIIPEPRKNIQSEI